MIERFLLANRAITIKKTQSQKKISRCKSSFFKNHQKKSYRQDEMSYQPLLLDVINKFSSEKIKVDLEDTYLIGVQHFLPSTVHFFEHLIKLGFLPQNMLFTDKPYSRVDSSYKEIKKLGVQVYSSSEELLLGGYSRTASNKVHEMWGKCLEDLKHKKIRKIIILDEGGRCIEQIPNHLLNKYKIVGIEQTRGGLYSQELSYRPFPVIEVASSAVKKYHESPIIAQSIIRAVVKNILKKTENNPEDLQYGIIGNGSLGLALARYFLSMGKIFAYDKSYIRYPKDLKENLIPLSSPESVMRNSDCVFFCTGQDSTKAINIFSLIKDKIFISCSSEDSEFRELLEKVSKQSPRVKLNPLDDIIIFTDSRDKILLASGGFPINFDRTEKSDPLEILLTRGLLMGSIIQAIYLQASVDPLCFSHNYNRIMLDPYIQQYVLESYAHYFPRSFSNNDLESKCGIEWIKENSGGNYEINNPSISLKM